MRRQSLWEGGFCRWGNRCTEQQCGPSQRVLLPGLRCPDIRVCQKWQSATNYDSQDMLSWSFLPQRISHHQVEFRMLVISRSRWQFGEACWILGDFSAASSHFLPLCYLPQAFFLTAELVNQCLSISKWLCVKFVGVHKHMMATIKVKKTNIC